MRTTRRLGWTELELTRIGLGTWAIGGGGWAFAWGPQDDDQSIKAIRRALDLGINWIDTAPAYGLGHSEEVVGRAIKAHPERPIIATKCGRSWGPDRKLYPDLKAATVRSEVEASLKRLQVDVIDLYQIHWPEPDEDLEEGWEAIAGCVKEGKIRYAGVCNCSVSQLRRIQPIHPVASSQPPYSMIVRGVEEELLPYCRENRIGVVPYSPMQKGLLTGKVTADWVASLPENDHRRRDPQFQSPLLDANRRLTEGLKPIAERHGKSLAHLAIAWVLRRPEITSAIVGARKPEQIEETVDATEWDLTDADIEAIESLLRERQQA